MLMADCIKILGNKINCFKSYRSLYDSILKSTRTSDSSKGYVTVNNVHTMIEGFWDDSYQNIINNSFLSIPDGKPLQIVGRLKGNKEISRLFGPTVMEKFIDWGRADEIKHFFFGSSEENLKKLKQAIEDQFPGTKIVGMFPPPFKPMSEWDNDKFVQMINDANPDFIWVGLGAPKQERWMYEQYKNLDKGILFGIGAGFDYLAGNTRHAPQWMKNSSLEWVYRLFQEPKRLWKRYLTTIPQFLFFTLFELIGIKLRRNNKPS
jgi:N-acetylglucosaminyldiphosphoundecaprenol N-acetyl-beta-D-mannosaminyltransferase